MQGFSVSSGASGELDPLSLFAIQQSATPATTEKKDNSTRLADFDMDLRSTNLPKPPSPTIHPVAVAGVDHTTTTAADEKAAKLLEEAEDLEKFPYFSGEQILLSLRDSYILHPSGKMIPGMISMTSFRMIFIPSRKARAEMQLQLAPYWFQIPLACIDKLDREKKGSKDIKTNNLTIVLTCKDARVYRIAMMCKPSTVIPSPTDPLHHTEADIEKAINVMFAYAFPNDIKHLFAFSYAPQASKFFHKLDPYDPLLEFSRIGILDSPASFWRVSLANMEFRICDSYPEVLVVPKILTDDEVKVVANFRSGGRLPVLCWGDKFTGASIWRSSQPKAGVSGSCALDERYLDIIAKSSAYHTVPPSHFESSSRNSTDLSSASHVQAQSGLQSIFRSSQRHSSASLDKNIAAMSAVFGGASLGGSSDSSRVGHGEDHNILMIIDCRPKANAMLNKAAGAGYEATSNYPNARIDFYNIGNIHVMRDSHRALVGAICNPSGVSFDLTFSKAVEDSQWLVLQ